MIGNSLVLSVESKPEIEEYERAYLLYDQTKGRSSYNKWKITLFFLLAIVMIVVLMLNGNDFAKVPFAPVIFIISVIMCIYYCCIVPVLIKKRGREIYKSSELLSKKCKFDIYRDHFVMKSENEILKRRYTELFRCIENDDFFLLVGGYEKPFVMISKKDISEENCRLLSEHFQREAVRQYVRLGRKNKK